MRTLPAPVAGSAFERRRAFLSGRARHGSVWPLALGRLYAKAAIALSHAGLSVRGRTPIAALRRPFHSHISHSELRRGRDGRFLMLLAKDPAAPAATEIHLVLNWSHELNAMLTAR